MAKPRIRDFKLKIRWSNKLWRISPFFYCIWNKCWFSFFHDLQEHVCGITFPALVMKKSVLLTKFYSLTFLKILDSDQLTFIFFPLKKHSKNSHFSFVVPFTVSSMTCLLSFQIDLFCQSSVHRVNFKLNVKQSLQSNCNKLLLET